LSPKGKIVFLLTLYEKKKRFKAVELVKPYLKYICGADFGKMTYESDFDEIVCKCGLEVKKKERVFYKGNKILKIFRFFYVETVIPQS